MKEYDLQKLMDHPSLVDEKITEFIEKRLLFRQNVDKEEMKGHLLKAEHNLRFVSAITKEQFYDWALVGCYYACYHAALASIQTRGYTSKNHLATLCIIIREFYRKELSKEDIELFSDVLDYEDILFYVEAKNRRETATYSTTTSFDKKEVGRLRIRTALFVSKITDMLLKKVRTNKLT